MSADLNAQIALTADATGVEAGVGRAKRSLKDLGATAAAEGKKSSEGLKPIGDEAEKSSVKVNAATKSLIGSIQRTTAALEAGSKTGSKYFETLANQRGVNVDVLKPYLAQLDAVSAKQQVAQKVIAAASPTLDKVGMSAKATAAALRGVPAQFTDIAVSIQGGQNPLTVFLQQGGQLKDMFGGIGQAARALGGYIVGLINPFTLAAGAAAALGYAYFQGSKEADAFAKAIVLSGNAAGTTVGQLTEQAKAIDRVVGTQSSASAALAEFAADGNIANASLERFTTVALRLEKEAGQAVKKTVEQFSELGKDPVAASIKLNETTRFLTDTVYQQIRALDEQGKTAEAATVAQNAYADAVDSRVGQLTSRLGIFQRAWQMLGKDAKEAWDLMLGVGRADTLQERIGKAQTELSNRIQRGPLTPNSGEAFAKGNAALQDRIAAMQETVRLENRSANAQKEAAARVQARISFDKESDKYLSKKVQMEREIAKFTTLADKAGASALEREKGLAGIREKFTEKGKKPRDTTRVDSAAQVNLDIAQIKAAAAAEIDANANKERLLEAQRSAGLINERDYYAEKKRLISANVATQVSALEAENDRLEKERLNTKDDLDRDRKVLENKQKIAKLTADVTAAQTILDIQATAALKQREIALLSASQAAQDYFDTLNKQQQRELDSFGAGRAQRDLNAGIAQIEDRYSGQKRDLDNNRAQLELEGKFTDDARKQYEDRLAIITNFQSRSIKSFEDYYAQRKELEGNAALGMSEGLQNYLDESRNVFAATSDAVKGAFEGMEDALVGFVTTGKLDFKSLADSIIADIARIAIRQSITGPLAGMLSGAFGGGGYSATNQAGLDGLIAGLSGRAIGGPVSAGGAYQVNERGPETLSIGNKQILLMGNQGGKVTPGATGGGDTYHYNFTVGDVATVSTVREAVAASERRTQNGYRRSRAYAGEAS